YSTKVLSLTLVDLPGLTKVPVGEQPEDIEVAGVRRAHLLAMADEPGHVRVQCHQCDEAQVVDDKELGKDLTCASCQTTFTADWGEPVLELPAPEAENTPDATTGRDNG
ncbi:MAG: AAA family ATPase, partial [Pirellulales bacterium]|nr:AAA family ATPase [Pirellulales bacterium]